MTLHSQVLWYIYILIVNTIMYFSKLNSCLMDVKRCPPDRHSPQSLVAEK